MDITSIDSNIIVENEEDKSISVRNKDIMVVNSEPEFEVTVQRKEYSIVGDELYIPKRYEDAPQWLRDLISTVTEESYARKITDLNNLSTSLQQLIVELEVAKNTYTQSIISSNDINERINTAVTTLNSSLSSSDATIVDLINTRATLDEASTIALNTISSSINNGEIGALVGSVKDTLTTETEALANNIDLIHAEMSDGFEGTADVIQATQAYVGINEAGASTGTGLSAYLEDSLGNVGGADSQVANGVYINNGVPTSKFEYTSDLSKNGVHYKSGFGLKTLATGGDGSAANPYDSEFWINAAKFKFTNDNVTGQVTPFTIDATGLTPNITFNGKVSFTNVTGTSDLVSTANIQNAIANNVTTIDAGKIVTNQVFVNNLNAVGGVVADTITGNQLNGTVVNGAVINGARINGSVIKASYLDLDGELEVLTNYHITVAMYNANPSLYTDAVYISADNEYRIPSMSRVTEKTTSATLDSSNTTYYGQLSAYNIANNGNNLKAVKIRPTFENYNSNFLTMAGSNTTSSTIRLRLGSLVVSTITITGGKYWIKATISSDYTNTVSTTASTSAVYTGGNLGTYETTTASSSVICNNVPIFCDLLIEINASSYNIMYQSGDNHGVFAYGGTDGTIKISTIGGQYELPFNWNSSDKINIQYVSGFSATAKLSGIAINNMI